MPKKIISSGGGKYRSEGGGTHLEEVSFMTNVAEAVGGQTLVYLNILHHSSHSPYFI